MRENARLDETELDEVCERLRRLDSASKVGAWTRAVLSAIREHPRLRAPDLAKQLGYEKDWLKTNVRKLKNLGLTISQKVGYTLSPSRARGARAMGTRRVVTPRRASPSALLGAPTASMRRPDMSSGETWRTSDSCTRDREAVPDPE